MDRDPTTDAADQPTTPLTNLGLFPETPVRLAALLLATMLAGVLLTALVYQLPSTHTIDIGAYDSAYVQGFYEPERADMPGNRPYLAGSDGAARWSQADSHLLLPQAGLPAHVTLRLRGWRAKGPPPQVIILAGGRETARFQTTGAWQEYTIALTGGLQKPEDVVVTLHAETAPINSDDPRQGGIVLDRAIYRVGPPPILPYPAQLAYAALASGMLWLLARGIFPRRPLRVWAIALAGLILVFILFYRFQPFYPYPLRGLLPLVCVALAALLAIQYGPLAARALPILPDLLAAGAAGAWVAGVFLAANNHLTLSRPGVENDFRVFATRTSTAAEVFKSDGFYNLGYPLLLWLTRPFAADNPFLAARLLAALSGGILLAMTWWLARRMLGPWLALLALAALALNPLTTQYALYVGSDMPFAALCTLAITLLIHARHTQPASNRIIALAGLAGGSAFLVRHPGMLLLPLGWLAISMWEISTIRQTINDRRLAIRHLVNSNLVRQLTLYTLTFVLAVSPQLFVNARDTGNLLYNQQAKNVWLAVYGDSDWSRWGEVSNTISLSQVALQNPGRFIASWWANLRGFFGTGAEDTSEFGRAIQLRMLGFPANWLAIGGLLAWLSIVLRNRNDRIEIALLLAWTALYVALLSVGISLQRFFLPLTPVYAIAAAWAINRLITRQTIFSSARLMVLCGMLLITMLANGFDIGTRYVLENQPADEVAIARITLAELKPGQRLVARVPAGAPIAKYSAIAHLVEPAPPDDSLAAIRATGADYLLWATQPGSPPPAMQPVGSSGIYTLYRIQP